MPSPCRIFLLGSLSAACFTANAATPKHDVYSELGAATISNGDTSTNAIHNKFGYNYYLTPFIALDINWVYAKNRKDGPSNKNFGSAYQGLGAAVKVQQPLGKRFTVYAKGGASSITFQENRWDSNQGGHVTKEESGIYPNASVGVDMLAPWKNFSVNANYNYQMLEGDYNASTFSIGFNYQFK